MDFDKKLEEHTKRLKMIEQEYAMTMGRIKELEELRKESSEGEKKKDKE